MIEILHRQQELKPQKEPGLLCRENASFLLKKECGEYFQNIGQNYRKDIGNNITQGEKKKSNRRHCGPRRPQAKTGIRFTFQPDHIHGDA